MLDGEQYRLIVESSPNMIWRADRTGACDYFNRTWLDFTGRTLRQEQGAGWAEGLHPDDFDRCIAVYMAHFQQRKPFEMNYRLKRKDGEYRWINDRGVPFYNDDCEFMGYIGSCMDVTEKVEGQMFKKMAHYDDLCKIYNRQYSFELLHGAFSRVRAGEATLCILMLDIDSFKSVNDTWGHTAGDIVLEQVADEIKQCVRTEDIVGRYGGDEFIIGVPNASQDEADRITERIREAVKAHKFVLPQGTFQVSVSVGIGLAQGEKTLEELIDKADKSLYREKNKAKADRYITYNG
jgi:diguanylate cyclase (GGDEF)-like protein/PAS domain S-box-containing protein